VSWLVHVEEGHRALVRSDEKRKTRRVVAGSTATALSVGSVGAFLVAYGHKLGLVGYAIALTEIISAICTFHVWWRADGHVGKRLLWSLAITLPVIGPMLYGAIYEELPAHSEGGTGGPPGMESGA
jgi:hypothetical protein